MTINLLDDPTVPRSRVGLTRVAANPLTASPVPSRETPGVPAIDTVNFYRVGEAFGEFSNFAAFPITLGSQRWPTTEHYSQAQKFEDEAYRAKIRAANSPTIAARLGRSRKQTLRRDWEAVKVGVMRDAVTAKFTQHDDLRALLLSTGDAKLVEHTENDDYWGDGGDGSGQNMLGRVLMQVRDQLLRAVPK